MSAFDDLRRAIVECNGGAAAVLARKGLDDGLDPLVGLDAVSTALQVVGDGFSAGDLWLPDLVGAADAGQAAMPILEEEIKRRGQVTKSLGTVVIGTVSGDIHSIGKSMVSVLLVAHGFRVIDVGADVPAARFVSAVRENHADILALSALLTTTAPHQGKVIEALTQAGLRDKVKIMVGGGAITQDFADQIGADGYGATAPSAVALAKSLLQRRGGT